MRAFIRSACLLLIAGLAGCVGTSDPPQPIPEDPNPFTYKTVAYPYEVQFAPAAERLLPAEMQNLRQFLSTRSARRGDTVEVGADTSPIGLKHRARIAAILARAGLKTVSKVDANLPPNVVALNLKEMVAVPPKCGKWPIFAGDAYSNAPSLFLGCALHDNLYDMVVDKRDLAVGRTPGPAPAEPGMRAVKQYLEGTSQNGTGGYSAGSTTAGANAGAGMTSGSGGANGQ